MPDPASAAISLVAYIAIFAWLNSNWILNASDSIAVNHAGGIADAQLIVWVLDWVSWCLRNDWSALYDPPIYHPAKGWLTGTEHFGTNQLLFLPAEWWTGSPLMAANLTAMAHYPLSAILMFGLLRVLGVSALPSFYGGLLLALGPFMVSGSLHLLQTAPTFYPLVALCLTRLRQSRGAGRAALCAFALCGGLLSSYYSAMMVSVVFVIWILVEMTRPTPGRGVFALLAAFVLVASASVLLVVSLPYLSRPEVHRSIHASIEPVEFWEALLPSMVATFSALDAVAFASGVLALAGLRERCWRRYVIGALAIAIFGVLIVAGMAKYVASQPLPGPLADIAALVSRFFRITSRGFVPAGFGFAILAPIGLEVVRRQWPRLGAAGIVVAIIATLATKASLHAETIIVPVDAFGVHQASYRTIGRLMSDRGGGPVLELPRRRSGLHDSRAMMGQLIHGAPLITGHTGYPPGPKAPLNIWIGSLPNRSSLNEIVCMTGLQWIILRPLEDWRSDADLARFDRGLVASETLMATYHVDGFRLMRLDERCRPADQ